MILYAMGMTSMEKAEYEAYQLKNVDKTLHILWRDNMAQRGGLFT